MLEGIELLEANADSAYDFDSAIIVVPLKVARNVVAKLETEIEGLLTAIQVIANSKDGNVIAHHLLEDRGYDKKTKTD